MPLMLSKRDVANKSAWKQRVGAWRPDALNARCLTVLKSSFCFSQRTCEVHLILQSQVRSSAIRDNYYCPFSPLSGMGIVFWIFFLTSRFFFLFYCFMSLSVSV